MCRRRDCNNCTTFSSTDHDIRAVVQVVADSVLMVLTGDDGFTSEHMLALEMGYRGQLSSSLAVDAAAYHNRYHDLQNTELSFSELDLTMSPPQLPVRVANEAKATSYGLELSVDWQIGIVEAPIELFGSDRLIGRVVVRSEVIMGQGLGGSDTLLGVEHQHLLQQVDSCKQVLVKFLRRRGNIVD